MSIFNEDEILKTADEYEKIRRWCREYIVGFDDPGVYEISEYFREDDAFIGNRIININQITINKNMELVCPDVIIMKGYDSNILPPYIKFVKNKFVKIYCVYCDTFKTGAPLSDVLPIHIDNIHTYCIVKKIK